MGYYTTHELDIQGVSEVDKLGLISSLRRFSEEAAYALSDDGSEADSCKWYEHEKELREFSTLHPDALFILSGRGEECGDIWKNYFRGGKLQVAKAEIKIAEFDERLLK